MKKANDTWNRAWNTDNHYSYRHYRHLRRNGNARAASPILADPEIFSYYDEDNNNNCSSVNSDHDEAMKSISSQNLEELSDELMNDEFLTDFCMLTDPNSTIRGILR